MNVNEFMHETVACCALIDRDNHVTDRDLCMAARTSGGSSVEPVVDDAMSGTVIGCSARDTVEGALGIVRRNRVRRPPALDGEREPSSEALFDDLGRVREPRVRPDVEHVARKRSAPPAEEPNRLRVRE